MEPWYAGRPMGPKKTRTVSRGFFTLPSELQEKVFKHYLDTGDESVPQTTRNCNNALTLRLVSVGLARIYLEAVSYCAFLTHMQKRAQLRMEDTEPSRELVRVCANTTDNMMLKLYTGMAENNRTAAFEGLKTLVRIHEKQDIALARAEAKME